MKINIITFHWSNNLGALVQSLCLKKFLNENFKNTIEFNNYLPGRLIKRERNSQINLKIPLFNSGNSKKKLIFTFGKKNCKSCCF